MSKQLTAKQEKAVMKYVECGDNYPCQSQWYEKKL